MMYVEFMKNFLLPDWERADGCYIHFGLLSQKTFDSYFLDMMVIRLDMMFVEFKKYFLLAYSSALMAVKLISVS